MRAPPRQPHRGRCFETSKQFGTPFEGPGQTLRDDKTVSGRSDRRINHTFPGQRPVPLMQLKIPMGGARNSGRQRTNQGSIRNGLSMLIQIHVGSGSRRRRFPEVKGFNLITHPDYGKAPTTQIACVGVNDRKHQCRRHCRVDGIAALFQHLDSCRSRSWRRRRHCPARGVESRRGRRASQKSQA